MAHEKDSVAVPTARQQPPKPQPPDASLDSSPERVGAAGDAARGAQAAVDGVGSLESALGLLLQPVHINHRLLQLAAIEPGLRRVGRGRLHGAAPHARDAAPGGRAQQLAHHLAALQCGQVGGGG